MSGAPFDLAVTDRLLRTTRAVRRRLDFSRPVEREVLLECVDLAQQAPTASNTQLWRWLIVCDPDKRMAIGDLYRSCAGALTNARKQANEDDDQTQRVYDSAEWLLDHIHEAPALVIPCLDKRPPENMPLVIHASTFGSIFPAVWSFQLALRSRGLGSALTTLHLIREKQVAELLGIPDEVMQVAMLPVAYTKGTDFKPAKRPSPESITRWDGWS